MNNKFNRLVLYACSFGKSGSVDPYVPWHDADSFGDILAQQLGLEFVNKSTPGWNNDMMFWTALNDINDGTVTPQDLVIIQWTFTNRAHHTEKLSVMSFDIDKDEHVKWYYSYMYDYALRITDVAVRTLSLSKPNIVFGFAEGLVSVNTGIHNNIRKRMYEQCNIITISDDPISLAFPDVTTPCCHFTKKGHQVIADKYRKQLEEINFENNYF